MSAYVGCPFGEARDRNYVPDVPLFQDCMPDPLKDPTKWNPLKDLKMEYRGLQRFGV